MTQIKKIVRLLSLVLPMGFAISSHAQSTANAPTLDTSLKTLISEMQPMTKMTLGPLDNKPLLVTFFASWCPPCRPEFVEINTLRKEFPESAITMIAINIFEDHFDDPRGVRMKRFLRSTAPNFPVLKPGDEDQALKKLGDLDRIPTVYLFDADGTPRYTFIHQRNATKTHITASEIRPHIKAAIRK